MPARIAVIGEALVDVFPDREVLGGAPFNVARNLAALGAAPLLATRTGSDARGRQVLDECQRWGLVLHGLQIDPTHATGSVQVQMLPDGSHRFQIDEAAAWDHLEAQALLDVLRREPPELVYFGSLAQRSAVSREAIGRAIDDCLARGARCLLDLNLRGTPDDRRLADESLRRADVVKVNSEELDSLLAWGAEPAVAALPWSNPAKRAAAADLVRRHRLQRLVVTRGERGWACFDASLGRWLEGDAVLVASVLDTVGAGDAFSALLLLGMAQHWPLEQTLERANRFAAAVCGLRGAVDREASVYAAARRDWAL